MTTAAEYALMAGASYISTRAPVNQFPVPDGWFEQVDKRQNLPSGFEATYFTNAATLEASTEIVISFAGTGPGASDWIHANIPLVFGFLSDQLRQAADYYLDAKAAAPADAKIVLTGHSLGGGLASLLAVFFGEEAFTFDQAPLRQSALTFTTEDPATGSVTASSVALNLWAYLAGRVPDLLAPLVAYTTAADPNNPNPNPADMLAARETRVTNINVQGEIVSSLPAGRIGAPSNMSDITNSTVGVSGKDLHAQSLLAAYLQSRKTAPLDSALNDVTFKLTGLLEMIFDKGLFAHETDPRTTDENFLERLGKH